MTDPVIGSEFLKLRGYKPMRKMTREFRTAWYQACTDGSFTQIQGRLIDAVFPTRRCCLGVALAVGEKLGLLEPDETHPSQLLSKWEMDALGIRLQSIYAQANDENEPAEGSFYPEEVLAAILATPVEEDIEV